jgi:hypothetical protein
MSKKKPDLTTPVTLQTGMTRAEASAILARQGITVTVFSPEEAEAFRVLTGSPVSAMQKGRRGRPGYPIEALNFALDLRRKYPLLKAEVLRKECLKKFKEDDLPLNGPAFRAWLCRKRTNRTN